MKSLGLERTALPVMTRFRGWKGQCPPRNDKFRAGKDSVLPVMTSLGLERLPSRDKI